MTSPMTQNRDVNVTVNANVDPYVRSLQAANEITLKLTDGLKKLDDKIASITKKAGAGITAAGTGGLLGLLGSAREAAQLEKSFESLSAATVDTGESMKRLVNGAKDLSREIPISSQALAGLMTQVKSLGIDGVNNITRLTRVAAELSAATNTAPGQLFTGLAELGRTFGNSIQNIERYGSSVTSLSQRMGVDANSILGFSNQIQAVGQKAGITEAQILGLSTAFQRVGADGFAGANAFNQVIGDITSALDTNSSRLNSYANLLKMTREQFAALAKDNPTEAFVRFVEAVRDQGGKASQVLSQFGLDGIRTQRVFAALTSGQADIRAALGLSNQAYIENTSTARSAAAAWDGASDSLSKLGNTTHNVVTNLGAPILHVFQPITEGVNSAMKKLEDLLRVFNEMPGVFSGGVTSFLSKGAGLVALGGAFMTVSWSAAKFLGVWRVLSGALGINVFRGVLDGLKGMPREMEHVSRTGTAIYHRMYATASAMRNGGRVGDNARGLVGQAALFPVRRFQQIGAELKDTARYPLNPEKRNQNATDPWSTYGMFQAGQRRARAMRDDFLGSDNATIRGIGERLKFAPEPGEESKQDLQMRRLRTVEEARRRAMEAQDYAIFSPTSTFHGKEQIALLQATEAEQNRGNDRYRPTDFASMKQRQIDRQLKQVVRYRGNIAAESAGKAFDETLSDEDTAKMANPFKKLADKISEHLKGLSTEIGGVTKTVMGGVETFFGQAVQRITRLAEGAKAHLVDLQGMATTGSAPGAFEAFLKKSTPAPTAATLTPQKIGEEVAKAQTAATTARRPGGVDIDAIVQASVVGMATRRSQAPGAPGMAPNMAAAGDSAYIARSVRDRFSGLAEATDKLKSTLLDGAKSLFSGMADAGKRIAGIAFGPWGMLATLALPVLVEATQKLRHEFDHTTDAMAYAGAEMANRLGRDFITPQAREKQKDTPDPADKDPFGTAEVKDARSAAFRRSYGNTMDQLDAAGTTQAKLDRMQQEINRGVQQNNGNPLDDAQRGEIRKLMISTFGLGQARDLTGQLDMSGRTASKFYTSNTDAMLNASGGKQRRLLDAVASSGVTDAMGDNYAGLAYALGRTASQPGYAQNKTGQGSDYYAGIGSKPMQDLVGQMVNDWNKQNPKNQIEMGKSFAPDDLKSFMAFLDKGAVGGDSKAAKDLADGLRDAGLEINDKGQLTADALQKLADAATGTSQIIAASAKTNRMDSNELNSSWRQFGGDDYISNWLGNTEAIDYDKKTQQLGQLAGGKVDGTLFDDDATRQVQNRIKQLTDLKNIIGDPNDRQYQALDKLLGTAYTQLGQVTNSVNSTPAEQLAVYTQALKNIDVSNPLNSQQFQSQHAQLEQMTQANVQTLHGYYLQVRATNRQIEYGEEDHNRSMAHMQRDFDIQMKETAYQREEQLRQSAYSYSESLRSMKNAYDTAFGDPAAFVSAKYNQGASSSLIGMQRQVEYLERSLSGLQNLRGMGVSNDVIKLLGLDKPENFAQVEKYLTDFANNPELVQRFNDTISKRLSIQDAIAQDPSNSQLVELTRQFNHAADEATKQYDHSIQVAREGFDRGVADMTESYTLGLKRTYAEMSRLGEDVSMTTTELITWAKNTGIAGINDLATGIQGAINGLSSSMGAFMTAASTAVMEGLKGTALGNLLGMFGVPGFGGSSSGGGSGGTITGGGSNGGWLGNFIGNATGGAGSGAGAATQTPVTATQKIVQSVAAQRGWGSGGQWNALAALINAESGWRNTAQNPSSSAYGLFQFLNSTWSTVGASKTSDPTKQTEAGLKYIAQRYGTPQAAWNFWNNHSPHWYAAGGVFNSAQTIGIGEAGPETVLPLNAHGAEFVARTLQASLRMMNVPTDMAELRRQRGGGAYASPQTVHNEYNRTDQSTTFSGAITVQAQDPREMQRKLDAQKRTQALTRPMARR